MTRFTATGRYAAMFWVLVALAAPLPLSAADKGPAADPVAALSRQLQDAIAKKDVTAANATIDMDAMLDRIVLGVSAPPEFVRGFRAEIKRNPTLLRSIIDSVGDDGSYQMLRVRESDGETHALFRMLNGGGAMNYHDWVVGKDLNGRVKFRDVYVALSGELVSQSVHRLYLAAAVGANPSLLDKLTGKEKEYASNLSKVIQMTAAVRAGKFQDGLTAYKSLPKGLQENKSLLLVRFTAAQRLEPFSQQEYDAVIADFRRLFAGDSCLDLICFDSLILDKKYREARESLDRIEAFTGPDAHLEFLRGNLFQEEGGAGNLINAEIEYRRAVSIEPTLPKPHWGLVALYLAKKDFDQTAAALTEIETTLHIKVDNIESAALYADFVKSEAYKKWKAAHTG